MRLPRLFVSGQAQLVQVRFVSALAQHWLDDQSKQLLDALATWLGEYSKAHQLALHAWSLSPTQLLLLVTPPDKSALAGAIQAIGRRLAPELKTGSVFEGRYKSAPVDPQWVLPAQIWVESAPVEQGYAAQAQAWPWSSAAGHAGIVESDRAWLVTVSDHEQYWRCGNTPFDRQANYRTKLAEGITLADRQRIDQAVGGQWALGSEQYLEQIAKVANRRVAPGRRGRPRKVDSEDRKVD